MDVDGQQGEPASPLVDDSLPETRFEVRLGQAPVPSSSSGVVFGKEDCYGRDEAEPRVPKDQILISGKAVLDQRVRRRESHQLGDCLLTLLAPKLGPVNSTTTSLLSQAAEVVDMRAAYYDTFGGPENIRAGERPNPAPDAEHMLVRTHAAGVGIWDLGIMAGLFGQVSLPRIPGAEVAGTVEVAAGGFSAGDRVFCSLWESGVAGIPDPRGGFAEFAAARVDRTAAIPDGLEFPEAAGLVISASTAYEGLVDRAKLKPGETVLVTAASGGVGSAAVQIARSAGAQVIAVASAPNSDYVRGLGAEVVVDYRAPDFVEQLRTAAPGGFDVLFDGTGNEVRDQALALVRTGGRAILIAIGAEPHPAADGVEVQSFGATVDSSRLRAVAELVSAKELRMPIEAEFRLERARQALEHVGGRHTRGRVVLQIRE